MLYSINKTIMCIDVIPYNCLFLQMFVEPLKKQPILPHEDYGPLFAHVQVINNGSCLLNV